MNRIHLFRLKANTMASLHNALITVIILLQSVSFVVSGEYNAVDSSIYHFDLYFPMLFPNNVTNQVSYLVFPTNLPLFGTVTVTLTGGYNYQRTHGILRKRFHILYHKPSKLFDQITEITDSVGLLPSQWKIGDLNKNTIRIPIYHLVPTANLLIINVEGTTMHESYPIGQITITDPVIVKSSTKP